MAESMDAAHPGPECLILAQLAPTYPFYFFFSFFCFLRPHSQHMEGPSLGVKLEL